MAIISGSQCGQAEAILQRFRGSGHGAGAASPECYGRCQVGTGGPGRVQEGSQGDYRGRERWQVRHGCGSLRRRDTRSLGQQRPDAQRGHDGHASESRISEKQSRPDGPGKCQQAASHSSRRTRGFAAIFAAGFCAARSIDRREIGSASCVRKWTHRAVHEPWFISEWQASIDALDEAFALGFADVPLHVPSRCCRIVSCAPQRKVCSFSDDIQLYLGLDDEISAFSASLDRKDRPPPMRCATVPQI